MLRNIHLTLNIGLLPRLFFKKPRWSRIERPLERLWRPRVAKADGRQAQKTLAAHFPAFFHTNILTMAPFNIQSQDYRDLLDIIDNLRSQGLDRYVALPEIIVCGDQSSGKSSVLEAISGLSFPTKDNLCTRFATELILRRHPVASVAVSIKPHHDRSAGEKERLQAFSADVDPNDPDVGPVIEAAKAAMGLVDGGGDGGASGADNRRFSNDVLRIELSGPQQQHLTLVDLPGLFQAGNAEQSADEAPLVRRLVLDYMTRPRSIILAVVSAAYDFANQAPDKLDEGSDSERAFVKMARNRDVHLQLGWHVLRNRDHTMRAASSAERDAKEAAFFTAPGSAWRTVEPAHLGIGPLRPKLSTVLMDHILSQLPAILADVDALLAECRLGLARLGSPRATAGEQRQYLSRISSQFSTLVTAAVNGSYTDAAFFGNVEPRSEEREHTAGVEEEEDDDVAENPNTQDNKQDHTGYRRRLRAVVQNRLTRFAKDMHNRGQTRKIVCDSTSDERIEHSNGKRIRRDDYVDEVKTAIAMSRGRELPGTFNPLVVGDLFRDQCKNWGRLADECTESVLQSCFAAVAATLRHITVQDTAEKILQSRINPAMTTLKKDMADATDRLLAANITGHPVTYNHYLTETVQKVQNDRLRASLSNVLCSYSRDDGMTIPHSTIETLLDKLLRATEPDMQRVAASNAIDYMEAYYKVALKSFIDNVSVLVVEQCLLSKLPGLFPPDTIYAIADDDIRHLAGENPDATAERARLVEKKTCLEACENELRRLDKHRVPAADEAEDGTSTTD
ncbi:hypothetical protein SPBR_08141 [Sporothrix brasiliensis 5110]|uniref:GED domain-containing protein n=1 Tax=Sporothrix brasiliensis 5110 TaxID=1398154 RepID=A0A0C2IH41_9PEZI|nr:uncharacterized protein SPBR_08141 [Sporothrix brasiliensis 5110]KIH86345.1 hypothetical protein SPBR_08141 [Sporothrix brasiliensis 5110]